MTTDDSIQDGTSDTIKDASLTEPTTETDPIAETQEEEDNGILDFMTADMAIELYQKYASNDNFPPLEWKFYGRRKPNEPGDSESRNDQSDTVDGTTSKEQQEQDNDKSMFGNTEFDFDESFMELHAETSVISDSLKLKKRPEPGSERKTNISDIMSDILKESHTETEE